MLNRVNIKTVLFIAVLLTVSCKHRTDDVTVKYELLHSSILQDVYFYSYLVDPPVQEDSDSISITKAVMKHDVIQQKAYEKEKNVFLYYYNNILVKADMRDFNEDALYANMLILALWVRPDGEIQVFTPEHFPQIDTLFR